MKQAGKVLVIIGIVLGFLALLGYLIGGITLIVLGSPASKELIIKLIEEGAIHSSFTGTTEEIAAQVQAVLVLTGGVLLVPGVFALAHAIVGILEIKTNMLGFHIANLVFSLLDGTFFGLIGSILLLVDHAGQKKAE